MLWHEIPQEAAHTRITRSLPTSSTAPPSCHPCQSCRKRDLLAYLHATRQRLLRLQVLAQWGNMAPAAAAVSRVLDGAAHQAAAARDAADQLAVAHAHITAVQVSSLLLFNGI